MRDVVDLLVELIRFDTTNYGDNRGNGETPCAEWIAGILTEAGYEPQLLHRADAPERGNVVLRVVGTERGLPGLVVHGHLDVVPSVATEWSVDPFAGEVRDGYVYGRGAIDMKDMVACMLDTLLTWSRTGSAPRRDVVFCCVADEEDAGAWGADWLVEEHPDLFAGCGAAIGEDGGQAQPTRDAQGNLVTLYPVAIAERGSLSFILTATGAPGHASRPSGTDAVSRLLTVLGRIQSYAWPRRISDPVRAQVEAMAAGLGYDVDVDDPDSFAAFCAAIGPDAAGPLPWTVRPTATVTILEAGSKVNVIPSSARAEVDVRCPPGAFEETKATIVSLVGDDADLHFRHPQPPCAAPVDSEWFTAMAAVITEFDPEGVVVPLCMGGGTDAKSFAKLGMQTYGFTPLGLDPEGRRPAGAHGIDERNTVAGLRAGTKMLHRFLSTV